MVEDIAPGSLGGDVNAIVSTPLGVFFSPWDADIGYELRLLPTIPVYRLYTDVTKEHLYTTDAYEYVVLGGGIWPQEGVGFRLFPNTRPYNGTTPTALYRLYHAGIRQHLWTTDQNEYNTLPGSGWTQEGVIGNLLPTAQAGSVPLYRMALANPPLHLWTTDANEYAVLQTFGWIPEGIIGFALP
jgi:hypothetical protein